MRADGAVAVAKVRSVRRQAGRFRPARETSRPARAARLDLIDASRPDRREHEAVARPATRQGLGRTGFVEGRHLASPSRGMIDTKAVRQAPGRSSETMPEEAPRHPAQARRAAAIPTETGSSARPRRSRSSAGKRSAAATTKSALGRPPRARTGECAARRHGHRRGARVDSDDEGIGLGPGPRYHRPTVTGTEVDDDPIRSGDPLSDLADVHLGQAPTDHGLHARNLHFIDERQRLVNDPAAPRVGIVVGSRSDIGAAEKASAVLDELGVPSRGARHLGPPRAGSPRAIRLDRRRARDPRLHRDRRAGSAPARRPRVPDDGAGDRRPDARRRGRWPRRAPGDRPDAEGRAGRDGRGRQRGERRTARGRDARSVRLRHCARGSRIAAGSRPKRSPGTKRTRGCDAGGTSDAPDASRSVRPARRLHIRAPAGLAGAVGIGQPGRISTASRASRRSGRRPGASRPWRCEYALED